MCSSLYKLCGYLYIYIKGVFELFISLGQYLIPFILKSYIYQVTCRFPFKRSWIGVFGLSISSFTVARGTSLVLFVFLHAASNWS